MSKQHKSGKEHQWKPGPRGGKRSSSTGCPWPVCAHCGLVLLKNAATAQAAASGCPGKDDDS